MSQENLLEVVLKELRHIKTHMPNGEMKIIQEDMKELKSDVSDLKKTLLNPIDGVIVNTNKNTEYREKLEGNEKEFNIHMNELEELKKWKANVNKALWIIFTTIAAIVVQMYITK